MVRQYVDGTVTAARVTEADSLNLIAAGLSTVTIVVAGVLFVVWMGRVRENAEFFCDAKHYYAREWAVLGWFVPVVSLWAPWQFMNNVLTASDPRVRARGDWIDNGRNQVVAVWWALWILQSATAVVSGLMLTQANTALRAEVPEKLAGVAMWSTISAVFCCAGAIAFCSWSVRSTSCSSIQAAGAVVGMSVAAEPEWQLVVVVRVTLDAGGT